MTCFRRWIGWLMLLPVFLSACQPSGPKNGAAPTAVIALAEAPAAGSLRANASNHRP